MRMTQKLHYKNPETGEDVWAESPTRHDLLTFLAIEYFGADYWDFGKLTGWVLRSDGVLTLLCGDNEHLGYLKDASWEE